jgi:hypothetical protein
MTEESEAMQAPDTEETAKDAAPSVCIRSVQANDDHYKKTCEFCLMLRQPLCRCYNTMQELNAAS